MMKQIIKTTIAIVAIFMSIVFVPGWANETATPVAELITTDVVVDDAAEFLVTTKNENGELVQTPVSELVTEPTEAPKVDSAEPIIPAESTQTAVAELVTEPTKPVVDDADPIIPSVTTDTPVAELVVEKEEPTPAPKPKKPEVPVDSVPTPKIPAPVVEKPELPVDEVPNIPAPVVEKPEVELPIIPTPVVEKPELTIPTTPAPKEEPKQPEPKTPVNPTPAPKVEEPKLPEPKTPEVPTTPEVPVTPEVPTTPVVEEPVVPVAPGATRNHTLRRLPLTGTEESNFTALAAVLTIVAIALAVASMKKEF